MMASDFVRRRAEAAGDRGAPEREGVDDESPPVEIQRGQLISLKGN